MTRTIFKQDELLRSQMKGQTDVGTDWKAWRAMNAGDDRIPWADARFEVVLGLVVSLVGEIIDGYIEVQPGPNPLKQAEIQDREAGSTDGGIQSI